MLAKVILLFTFFFFVLRWFPVSPHRLPDITRCSQNSPVQRHRPTKMVIWFNHVGPATMGQLLDTPCWRVIDRLDKSWKTSQKLSTYICLYNLMNEWMNERTNEWLNDWMNEWMNEGMNERTNERMNESDITLKSFKSIRVSKASHYWSSPNWIF